MELGKPLSSLTHEDLLIYQRFLSHPQPASRWIMKNRKVSRSDPLWRPFAGPLSPTSQRQTIVILNALFSWLVNAGYLAGNPLSLSRQRQRKAKPRITRLLDEELWNEVKITIETMPKETNRQREHYHRVRWLFSLLYITGMRVSEVINNSMGAFFMRKDKDNEYRWWLEVTGKGEKTRLIPATNDLIMELDRYRREMGLSQRPVEGEEIPLLLPIGGKHRFMTRAVVHLILKQIFNPTADRLLKRGHEFKGQAEKLLAASCRVLEYAQHMKSSPIMVPFINMKGIVFHYFDALTNRSPLATTSRLAPMSAKTAIHMVPMPTTVSPRKMALIPKASEIFWIRIL